MVDSPNYANSPLTNPDFLNRVAPAPTSDPGFAPMAPGILDRAIAQEPVFQAKTLEERKRELEIEQAKLRDRSAGEIIQDSLLTGANAAASGVVAIGSLALKGTGAAVEALAPEGSIAQDIGGLVKDRAMIQASDMTNGISGYADQFKSETALRNAELDGQISQINDEINLNQYKEDLAAGDSEFIASLSLYGRQALDFGERMTDPVAALDLGANALGSIASGSILSKIGTKIATGVAERFGMEGVKKLGLEYGGSALGMGVTEASSTYVSTVDAIMGRTPEEMASSDMYNELTAQGMAHEEAQAKVADSAGLDAFINQLPAAMTAGLLSAKFNANPLSVMRGENPLGVFITAGKEALEETAQGATGQYNQNKAIRDFVDPSQALDEGVVDQAMGGLLGGFAASGVIGAPSGIINGFQEQSDRIREEVAYERFVKGMGDQIAAQRRADARAAMTPAEREAELRASMTQTSPAEDLFNSVVSKASDAVNAVTGVAKAATTSESLAGAVETVKAGIQTVKEAAAPVVNTVIKAAQDYVEKPNVEIQNETVKAAEEVSKVTSDPEVDTGSLGSVVNDSPDSIPEVFKDSMAPSTTIADTMTNIVKVLAEKKISISEMKDDAILYVTQKYAEMESAASTLAPEIRDKVKKVLASPQLDRIRKRAARLDLNTAISSTVEKISSTVKAMTVAMSKINPTNINPDVADKILKQEDKGDLTPEDVQSVEVAASVARPLNNYKANIVKIATEKYQALKASGENPEMPETNLEKVSRNLLVGNLNGENKVPSVNDFANRIIIGMRSADKAVEIDGVRVPVTEVASNLGKLVQHMVNKVNALNESFDMRDANGVGPKVNHDTLVRGKDFIKAGMAGSAVVNYSTRSINSVTFAKTVAADADVLGEVFNALVKAYPEAFPDGPVTIPGLKTLENPTGERNTTAVEEVPSAGGTDENAGTTQESSPPTTAVEDATPVASETIVIGLTQEKADAMNDEELIASVNSWEPGVQSTMMEQSRVLSVMAVMDPLIAPLQLPDNMIRMLAWLKSDSPSHAGQAYWAERVISLKPRVVKAILAGEEAGGIHIFFHELFHIIDAKASKVFGRTASMDAIEFDLRDGGEIYDEVKALSDSDPEFKEYFSYALSFSTPEEVASEIFAEIGAMMMLMDREQARKLLPKGVAYVERIIEQAGGAKAQTNGDTTPVSDQTTEGDAEAEGKVTDRFVSVFRPKKAEPKAKSANEILELIGQRNGTEVYREFASVLLGRIYNAMNERVATLKRLDGNTKTIVEGLKEDQASVLEIRDFKPAMIINPETGKYDQRLLDLASMAVIDWMTTARAYGADRLDDLLKELDLKPEELSDNEIRNLLNSVPTRTTSEQIARKVMKLWNVQGISEAQMVDIRGTTEGLVKEIITVLSQMEDPLVRVIEIKVGKGKAAAFEVSNLKGEQEAIGLEGAGSLDKTLFPEESIMASFGEPLTTVPSSPENKPDVKLSKMERKAIKNMQDIAHTEAKPVVEFFQALGLDAWATMAGKRDSSQLAPRHPLKLAIEGKNTSIERDFESAMEMVAAAAGRPVFYPIGVTNVGRHQMKGLNPQNNKILRALLTPTHSKLDMANNQKHKDNFWLTVAQSSGVAKVEKKLHNKILATIQEDFQNRFGDAVALATAYLENGSLDQEAFVEAMLKANKGEAVEVAQVNAVLAVARLRQAQRKNDPTHLENFETSLSFELDGKTDGSANMMVAFGQGLMTRFEYENFKRIGFFLGSKVETLNTLFSSGDVDLYEVNSSIATKGLNKMIDNAKGTDKARLKALQRFNLHFGDFEIKDGQIVMSRASSKNPMTKKVYGSSAKGIAEGITQDMLMEFYTQLVDLPDGVSVEDHLNYPEINDDLVLLFEAKIPDKVDVNKFILPADRMKPFEDYVKDTIGSVLSDSINEVMSEKTTKVNDLVVYTSGVQGEFMRLFFEQRLAEVVDEARKEWEASGQESKFALRKLSQAAYDQVVAETMAFAPSVNDGLQTIQIGDFSGQVNNTEMSSNMNGNIRSKSTMQRPDTIGVKAIAYLIQGRGDAMMMNRIFSADNAPSKVIPIFDGIDMAISDFSDLSNQINEAVLQNWDHDILGPIGDSFNSFLDLVKSMGMEDKLDQAFDIIRTKNEEKTSVTALEVNDLKIQMEEAVRLNRARKAVFKQITLSVDHMGGSGVAYVRNADGQELTFEEINKMIQDQMDGKVSPSEPTVEIPQETPVVTESTLVVTDVATVTDAVMREAKPYLREVIRSIRTMLPDGARIVMGTEEEIAKWRAENSSGRTMDQKTKGFYDVDSNTIFILSDNHETIVHEMIHMATFQAVLEHYQGTKKSTAVKNLEVLMEEFLAMDTKGMSKEALEAYSDAKLAIIKGKAEATAMGDAVALNEFMAWTLANDHLMKELKQTPTSLVARLTKVAKSWIQKILGVVPIDMYGQILFNTEMIRNEEFPGGFETLDEEELTQEANTFTNFWIDLLRNRLADAKDVTGLDVIATAKKQVIQQKLGKAFGDAEDALKQLDFGGFALNDNQKHTFRAIYMVISTELRLDSKALITLGKTYEHIVTNLTPAMFGAGQAGQDRYSAVMELMGAKKNDEGISDAIVVLLALSQTSTGFRKAMEQLPQPVVQRGQKIKSLNDLLTTSTGYLMQKMISLADTDGKGVKEALDVLSDKILREDNQSELKALKGLMGTFTKADKFVGGLMSTLAQKAHKLNVETQKDSNSAALKVVSGAVALATSFMDPALAQSSAKAIKTATHMGGILDQAVFIRELVTEVLGADSVNTDVIQMLDKVNYVVQSSRQAYREELPVILQNEFKNHPNKEQWKALHNVLGKGDFAALFNLKNPDDAFDLLNDDVLLDQRIKAFEKKVQREFPGQTGSNMILKAKQLADFMNGKGAGFQLFKNAYAIHKLVGGKKPFMVKELDKLISLYALKGTDLSMREAVADMQASDPDGVHNLLVYVQALNKEEDQKTISEAARMNGYKGYIPDHAKGEVSLIIAADTNQEDLERRGYTRVADDKTDSGSLTSRGYYMSTTKQSGNYSQGVLQQVQDTYRGVNATTGLTVNGTTSGVISGVAVLSITDALNNVLTVNDNKHVLIPVMDADGGVLHYERAINPDLAQQYLQPESNMALMVGAWAGRQVEEKFSHEYNKALIDSLKKNWDERLPGEEKLFVKMNEAKDKIYAESWSVIPPQLKEHIIGVFGEENGFMVRRDMINLALGYRDPSITDVWTGNHRLPEPVTLAIKAVGRMTMGDKAFKWLANTETVTMNTVSSAKDLIVVRSLVVPYMNTQSNVFQLVNRGVGTKSIMKGYRDKFAEIDKLNENLKRIMGLQARIRLAATDKNKVAILKQQIQVLEDENKRFSVAPLVEAGAYKTISEGMTDLDVSITDGKFGDWFEAQLNKLPAGVQTVAKYGLLSKDTAIYRGANKAVQYGDFIAKSIYYDHLIENGMTKDEALAKVNEEFINFSLLPGRARTYLESMGATWFLTFKIRAMKTALQMMRENPVRSLAGVGLLGLESGPITDNLVTKAVEGTLPYSLGLDMLWDAPSMNPWVAATEM